MGEILQQQAIQNEIDRRRHEQEMRALEREHQLRMEAIRQEESNRERGRQLEAEQRGQEQLQEYRRNLQAATAKQEKLKEEEAQREREIEKIENKHPGWRNLVKSKGFNAWYSKQPESLRRLGSSEKADDAITVLDLYKRDRGARR